MLAIPFRGDGGERERILEKTVELLRNLYNWEHIELFDSNHPVFNRSASRNRGVFAAVQYGCDVVVVCDADSIPEQGPSPLAAATRVLERSTSARNQKV